MKTPQVCRSDAQGMEILEFCPEVRAERTTGHSERVWDMQGYMLGSTEEWGASNADLP